MSPTWFFEVTVPFKGKCLKVQIIHLVKCAADVRTVFDSKHKSNKRSPVQIHALFIQLECIWSFLLSTSDTFVE